jgi:hypothetical protein
MGSRLDDLCPPLVSIFGRGSIAACHNLGEDAGGGDGIAIGEMRPCRVATIKPDDYLKPLNSSFR